MLMILVYKGQMPMRFEVDFQTWETAPKAFRDAMNGQIKDKVISVTLEGGAEIIASIEDLVYVQFGDNIEGQRR